MRVEKTIYLVATISRPIMFDSGDGNFTDDLDEAAIYRYPDEAQDEISEFDEPEKYEIIKGTIGIEV